MQRKILALLLLLLLATGCRATFEARAWHNGGELSARLEVLNGDPSSDRRVRSDPNIPDPEQRGQSTPAAPPVHDGLRTSR